MLLASGVTMHAWRLLGHLPIHPAVRSLKTIPGAADKLTDDGHRVTRLIEQLDTVTQFPDVFYVSQCCEYAAVRPIYAEHARRCRRHQLGPVGIIDEIVWPAVAAARRRGELPRSNAKTSRTHSAVNVGSVTLLTGVEVDDVADVLVPGNGIVSDIVFQPGVKGASLLAPELYTHDPTAAAGLASTAQSYPHLLAIFAEHTTKHIKVCLDPRRDLGVDAAALLRHPLGRRLHHCFFRHLGVFAAAESCEDLRRRWWESEHGASQPMIADSGSDGALPGAGEALVDLVQVAGMKAVAAAVMPFLRTPPPRRAAMLFEDTARLGSEAAASTLPPSSLCFSSPIATLQELSVATAWHRVSHIAPPLSELLHDTERVYLFGDQLAVSSRATDVARFVAERRGAEAGRQFVVADVFGDHYAASYGAVLAAFLARYTGWRRCANDVFEIVG
jgi:hypothetical protein